ncbi:MAG TPA: hypothetical protein VFU47_05950, partial [Armatimonadota bacterium]|nr:hypothetical protein [Armatimonadota bacterium]
RVSGDAAAVAWARHLLNGVHVCETLEEAAARRRTLESVPLALGVSPPHYPASGTQHPTPDAQHPTPALWVTRAGQWLARSGAASGGALGAEGSAAAALARRRELDRLREEVPALLTAAETAREAVREAEAAVRRTGTALRERQSLAEKARLEHQAQLREADRRNGDVERARHRLERLKADRLRSEQEAAGVAEALNRAREEMQSDTAASEPGEQQGAVTAAEEKARLLEAARREAETAVTELRVRLAQQEQRLQGAAAATRRAAEGGAFLDRQRSDRLNEQRTLTAESEQRALSFETLAAAVADAQAAGRQAREELAALAETRTARTAELNAARASANDLSARLRELMERCHRAEVELTALDTQRQHLGQQWLDATVSAHSIEVSQEQELEEPLTFTLDGLLATWNQEEAELTLASYSDPEAEINRLRRQIRSLGAVNPDAVEQYAETQERYDFLTSQRADLESAREQLEGAIAEIDQASKETFLAAFKQIAAAFDEMFKKLFGGGATELRLTDPSDVLETGIDIIVQPPGKKQQNLLLLSGGERALTAAAMLFALLKVKPSPFCVMDEVDAPLDESNVGRFASTLREFSEKTQFIVVTHNRNTVQAADVIYGVTMGRDSASQVLSLRLDQVSQVVNDQ